MVWLACWQATATQMVLGVRPMDPFNIISIRQAVRSETRSRIISASQSGAIVAGSTITIYHQHYGSGSNGGINNWMSVGDSGGVNNITAAGQSTFNNAQAQGIIGSSSAAGGSRTLIRQRFRPHFPHPRKPDGCRNLRIERRRFDRKRRGRLDGDQ